MNTTTLVLLLVGGWILINALVLIAASVSAARSNRSAALEEVPLGEVDESVSEHTSGDRTRIRRQVVGSSSVE
jgi:hypothetical protein